MSKYVYALTEKDRDVLTSKGFTYLGEKNFGKQKAYLFECDRSNVLTFNGLDRKRFLFSNIVFI